jgi:hypothetical protein
VAGPSGDEGEELASVGPPLYATANTTRVNGADPVADAAGVALAVWPPGGGDRPPAVTLVDSEDWATGIAAASLVAEPVGAPILYSRAGGVPGTTRAALAVLDPSGRGKVEGTRLFATAGVAVPDGLHAQRLAGKDASEIAEAIDRLRSRLADQPQPSHLLVASLEDPRYAMPAAAWAARSGDPVLLTGRDDLPAATARALRRHRGVPVYVLGPPEVVSRTTMRKIRRASGLVTRVEAKRPGASEFGIEFARYADEDFGWDINDPGHGFVLANVNRPGDAGAAAPLSAAGKWGPLLLTDSPVTMPKQLEQYLLDLKPGYAEDPTRAVYNHAFLIGDESAIAVGVQGRIDDLLELTRVKRGLRP